MMSFLVTKSDIAFNAAVTEEGRRLAGHYFKHWMRLTDDADVFISKEPIESERVNG